jgi:hypothetical protein
MYAEYGMSGIGDEVTDAAANLAALQAAGAISPAEYLTRLQALEYADVGGTIPIAGTRGGTVAVPAQPVPATTTAKDILALLTGTAAAAGTTIAAIRGGQQPVAKPVTPITIPKATTNWVPYAIGGLALVGLLVYAFKR